MVDRVAIHLGPHKTGSTFLQRRVFDEEVLGFASPWEPLDYIVNITRADPADLSAASLRAHFAPGIERVQARGLIPVLTHESLYGFPWEGGFPNRWVLDLLADAFPTAKVMFVAREQRDMLVSMYRHRVRGFYDGSVRDFLADAPPGHLPVMQKRYIEYDRVQRQLIDRFGSASVRVFLNEDLFDDPFEFVCSVVGFFGGVAPIDGQRFAGSENQGISAAIVALKRFANRLSADVVAPNRSPYQRAVNAVFTKLESAVPRPVEQWFERRLRRIVAEEIGDRYAESNAAMQRAQPETLSLERLGAAGYALP